MIIALFIISSPFIYKLLLTVIDLNLSLSRPIATTTTYMYVKRWKRNSIHWNSRYTFLNPSFCLDFKQLKKIAIIVERICSFVVSDMLIYCVISIMSWHLSRQTLKDQQKCLDLCQDWRIRSTCDSQTCEVDKYSEIMCFFRDSCIGGKFANLRRFCKKFEFLRTKII